MKRYPAHIRHQISDLEGTKQLGFVPDDPALDDLAIYLAYELIDGTQEGDVKRVKRARSMISDQNELIPLVARALRAEHKFKLEDEVNTLYVNETIRQWVRNILAS